MFFIRQAQLEDAPTLLKLAKMVHFINLPADMDIIQAKIRRSRLSFAGEESSERDREFMFVLEDTETGNVIGTSSVIACVSWPGKPHVYFQTRKREHYSEDLQTGAVHVTLQLETDETGPSEIGGLILGPSYRGHKDKLGSFLSLIRFHFIGLNRERFSERMIAEMMAPLTPDSRNTLWEYLGRRFINLSYAEADMFCQHSKEFMTSLLPRCEIYVSLLPPEARNLIGKVGKETEPAKAMLESMGFKYIGHIDPFDGGPYLEARLSEIPLVVNTRRAKLRVASTSEGLADLSLVSTMGDSGFRAVRAPARMEGDFVTIAREHAAILEAGEGDEVGVTILPARSGRRGRAKDDAKRGDETKKVVPA